MNSRERVEAALAHKEPDKVPVDFGGGGQSGMHVSMVYKLRQALGLDKPGAPVRVVEPYQMLGEIAQDLRETLEIDVAPLAGRGTMFGFPAADFKEWRMPDGTPVLVPGGFNCEVAPDGYIYQYPEGDKSTAPSGKMPPGGHFFDAIIRQEPIDETRLDPEDNLEEFSPVTREELEHYRCEAQGIYMGTDKAAFLSFGGLTFGDIALVPGVGLKHPKGIRDIEEWYISTLTRQDYVKRVFERQSEIALANLAKLREAVGNKAALICTNGTDFGTQRGPFLSRENYRKLFLPYQKKLHDWIHRNTKWKVFMHCCGGVEPLLNDFIEAGFDILNPVQCSAAGMEPGNLKARYGDRLTFWGGGVDTQRTLPFGTPEEVSKEVGERIGTFRKGGGFVFSSVHNVQAGTPIKNLLAMFEAIKQYR